MFEIDLRSLKRFRVGTRLRFVVVGDFGDEVPAEKTMRRAAQGATDRLTRTGNTAYAAQWVMSAQGWTGWLHGWRDLDDAEEWFTELVAFFPHTQGKVIGGPRENSRQQLDPWPTLGAHLYLTTSDMRQVDSDDRGRFWGVDEATTEYVCEQMIHWVHMPRATEWIANGGENSFQTRGLDHARSAAEMVHDIGFVDVEAALTTPLRYRTAMIRPHGEIAVRVVDPTMGWPDRLAAVKELLTWSPPRSDYGYVCHMSGASILEDLGKTWPFIKQSKMRYNRPLLTSFVPDAYGIQLLRDAHLERANDLSDWDITPLPNGRHLVVARDLDAWYRPIEGLNEHESWDPANMKPADDAVIAKARADFGDMILTLETITQHNPWK